MTTSEFEVDALQLYFGEPFSIPSEPANDIVIFQPTIGDIIHEGEKKVYSALTVDGTFIIKFDRKVKENAGARIVNRGDKFPSTVKLTLKALVVDPCEVDTLRAAYIVIPSFQVSPELEISLTTDGQLQYSGSMQMDYCSADKSLYEIYYAEDDEEKE